MRIVRHMAAIDVDVVPERSRKQMEHWWIRGVRYRNDEFADKWKMGHSSIVGEHDEIPLVHVVSLLPQYRSNFEASESHY